MPAGGGGGVVRGLMPCRDGLSMLNVLYAQRGPARSSTSGVRETHSFIDEIPGCPCYCSPQITQGLLSLVKRELWGQGFSWLFASISPSPDGGKDFKYLGDNEMIFPNGDWETKKSNLLSMPHFILITSKGYYLVCSKHCAKWNSLFLKTCIWICEVWILLSPIL